MINKDTYVISSDIDGADLRRQQHDNPRFVRAAGSHDEQVINDILLTKGNFQISIPAEAWERIFKRG